jgi:microcystin-dependent protein
MAEPFLGQISIFAFDFAPHGWAMCNGTLMPISQNTALFSLLGTFYGGNGTTTFALPNLQGSTPIAPNGTSILQGSVGGEANHTLVLAELPTHTHTANARATAATTGNPNGAIWANGGQNNFTTTAPNNSMSAGTIAPMGGSQPHPNTPPFLVLTFCIALQGIFPARN